MLGGILLTPLFSLVSLVSRSSHLCSPSSLPVLFLRWNFNLEFFDADFVICNILITKQYLNQHKFLSFQLLYGEKINLVISKNIQSFFMLFFLLTSILHGLFSKGTSTFTGWQYLKAVSAWCVAAGLFLQENTLGV